MMNRQIGLEEMADVDVVFTIAFEFILFLTKAIDEALIYLALGLPVLDEELQTWVKNQKLLVVLFQILVLTDLAKPMFALGKKDLM